MAQSSLYIRPYLFTCVHFLFFIFCVESVCLLKKKKERSSVNKKLKKKEFEYQFLYEDPKKKKNQFLYRNSYYICSLLLLLPQKFFLNSILPRSIQASEVELILKSQGYALDPIQQNIFKITDNSNHFCGTQGGLHKIYMYLVCTYTICTHSTTQFKFITRTFSNQG